MSERLRNLLPFLFSSEVESSPEPLRGKGIWARPRAGGTSELERASEIARPTNATHILYKVANGASYFEASAQAAQRISAAGLVPFAWMWLPLRDPAGEAQAAARAFQDGFQGLVFNVEPPDCSRKSTEARALARAIRRAGLNLNQLYNCSFPNIFSHQDLPYDELNEICRGGLMPMVYGTFFAPGDPTPWENQARKVIDDWAYGHYERWCNQLEGDCPPLHPVLGPYHDEYGSARMRPEEFQVWLDRLAAHKPSFLSMFTAAVIDEPLLPLIRSFSLAEEVEERPLVPETVWVPSLEGTVLYESPGPAPRRLRAVIYGTALEGLAWRTEADGDRWLQVRAPDGELGWVPEDRFALTDPGSPPSLADPPPPPPGQLTHVWTQQEVNYRSQPMVHERTLSGRLYPGARMQILEDPVKALAKLGKHGQWFKVQLEPDGVQGWIAAWYVIAHPPEEEPVVPVVATHVRVHSPIGLNVRAAPSTSAGKVWHVPDGAILQVQNPQDAAGKIGKQGQWIRIRTPSLHEGYVAAWYLRADVQLDHRRPVSDAALPMGRCAWIFGIHAAGSEDPVDFRHLFHGTGKTGWILFTEAIGANPAGLQPNQQRRQRLWDWARSGYGVIVRLNHAYEPSGTLPRSNHYQSFADTCARYAELYLKHPEVPAGSYTWVIVIANEQNNPREWPGANEPSPEPITPRRYAHAFNLAYRAIKGVLPNAIVVTGAVDPYNAALQRPLDYFTQMLDRVERVDGFALHTYTHGPHVELITKRTKFSDDPIKDHYYDFQAYRPFAEAIPPRWRNHPLYITESNHWTREDGSTGWVNRDFGWVRAAYKEIHRWNSTPHAQQIRALMIYRWLGDEWAIQSLNHIHADFRAALANEYRWRR